MPRDRKFWHEIEGYKWETVLAIQNEFLRQQIEYVYNNSEFYRRKFDEAKIKPEQICSMDDLETLPLTKKKELRDSLEKYPPLGNHISAPPNKIVRIGASSGTTGKPTYYGVTWKDVHSWNESCSRIFYAATINPGVDINIHLAAMSRGFAGGVLIQDSFDYMGVTCIPLGAEAGTERILHVIRDQKPTFSCSTPAFIYYLGQRSKEIIGIPASELSLKKFCMGGEPFISIKNGRERLEEIWGGKVYETMGMGDFVQMYGECEYQNGMHFMAREFLLIQLMDQKTGKIMPFKEGNVGVGIYTHLNREASPVVRYDTSDILQVVGMDCPCGRTGPRLKCIGRSDDMLIVKGINVFPSAIKDVVASMIPKTTGEIKIVLDEPEYSFSHPLKLKVEHGEGYDAKKLNELKEEIERNIRSRLSFSADVILLPPGSLAYGIGGTMKVDLFERIYLGQK